MRTERKCLYSDINIKKYTWNCIEDIWVSQQNDWTCQLAALRIVLRYYHMDIPEKDLVRILEYEKFNIFDFGTYLPFIGVIALQLGFDISYRTVIANEYPSESSIISSDDTVKKIILDDMQNSGEGESIIQAYNAFLKILNLGGKIYLHQPYSPPTFREIKNALRKGVVMALVSGREYYNINEDWKHALVLVSDGTDNFMVLDDFEKKGFDCYVDWGKNLANAKKYDWTMWKGRMIEFEKKE